MATRLKKFIRKFAAKMGHGSFARNVLIMFTGTALGQMCTVLLSPVLTRIYSPDLFGIAGFFSSLVTIAAVLSSLRYNMALPLAKDKKEAANLLAVCMFALFVTTCLFYLVLLLLPGEWAETLFGSLTPYIMLLPVGFVCIGAYQVMMGYATREGAFGVIAKTKVYQGISGPFTQIGLGLAGAGAWGLIIGFIVGQSSGLFNMISRLVFKPRDVLTSIHVVDMKILAKRYIHFPLISTWSALISAFGSNHLLLVIVPLIYSTTIAGFIFLTDRLIGRPLLLISTSILQVYIGEAAKTQNSDPVAMRRRFLQITRIQFFIVSFWLAIINATAFYFVPIIFGNEWADAAIYINILSVSYLPLMVMTSVTHTLQILEKQGLMAIWEIIRCILILSGFGLSYFLAFAPEQALLLYSSTQALMQVALFITMYCQIQKIQPKKQ